MNTYDQEFWDMLDKLFRTYNVVIDRAKGTAHPRYSDYIYPLDYGYLEGTVSSDGAGIDVWVGSAVEKKVCGIISSVDFIKRDSEIKILFACTPEEVELIYTDHNRTDGMKGMLSLRETVSE